MRRLVLLVLAFVLLTGCSKGATGEMDRVISLRKRITEANGCTFDAVITADYSDKIYTFGMKCHVNKNGDLNFTVTSPESISQITGKISETGGKLTFDDQVLAFEMLADGILSPVSAPWLMIRSLRSGYIRSSAKGSDGIIAQLDDTFQQENLQTQLWINEKGELTGGELMYAGRRILSVEVTNFVIV